jgi:hypothetical protein
MDLDGADSLVAFPMRHLWLLLLVFSLGASKRDVEGVLVVEERCGGDCGYSHYLTSSSSSSTDMYSS